MTAATQQTHQPGRQSASEPRAPKSLREAAEARRVQMQLKGFDDWVVMHAWVFDRAA